MRTRAVLLIGALVVITACGGTAGDPTGQTWQLTELEGQPPVEGTQIDMTLEDGEVFGSSGCNRYIGSAEVGDGSFAVAPDVAGTMRACADEVMTQEDAFLAVLTTAPPTRSLTTSSGSSTRTARSSPGSPKESPKTSRRLDRISFNDRRETRTAIPDRQLPEARSVHRTGNHREFTPITKQRRLRVHRVDRCRRAVGGDR